MSGLDTRLRKPRVSFTKGSATLTQLRTSPLCFHNILSLRWLRDDTRYR